MFELITTKDWIVHFSYLKPLEQGSGTFFDQKTVFYFWLMHFSKRAYIIYIYICMCVCVYIYIYMHTSADIDRFDMSPKTKSTMLFACRKHSFRSGLSSISRHWVFNTVCLFNIKHVPLFTVSFIHVRLLITLTVPSTESCTEEAEVTGEMFHTGSWHRRTQSSIKQSICFSPVTFFTYFYTFSAVQNFFLFAIITNKLGIWVLELCVTIDSSVVCCRDSRKQHWMRTLASTKNWILF